MFSANATAANTRNRTGRQNIYSNGVEGGWKFVSVWGIGVWSQELRYTTHSVSIFGVLYTGSNYRMRYYVQAYGQTWEIYDPPPPPTVGRNFRQTEVGGGWKAYFSTKHVRSGITQILHHIIGHCMMFSTTMPNLVSGHRVFITCIRGLRRWRLPPSDVCQGRGYQSAVHL